MKLPNGYGTVKKLSGKRRNPYMVQKTIGWDVDPNTKKLKQIRETIGYYPTRSSALQALAQYNTNPFDLKARKMTFGELYELWSAKHYANISPKTIQSYTAAYKYCSPIVDIPIADIKTATLQELIDACPCSSNTKSNIKVVMMGVFTYAEQNDLVNNNYAKFVKFETSDAIIDRIPYSDEEIAYLFEHSKRYEIQIVLILLYSGMRVNELLKMPRECCHLDDGYLEILEAKNKASIRKVPIHPKVFDYVKGFYDKGGTNLIVSPGGAKVPYNNFVSRQYKKLNEEMNTTHHLHDTRHTFITKGHTYKLDALCLKKIVGHAPDNITQKIYTHITLEQLQTEMRKIK